MSTGASGPSWRGRTPSEGPVWPTARLRGPGSGYAGIGVAGSTYLVVAANEVSHAGDRVRDESVLWRVDDALADEVRPGRTEGLRTRLAEAVDDVTDPRCLPGC